MENPIILILYWFENFCLIIMGGVLFGYFSPQNLNTYIKISVINAFFLYFIRNLFNILHIPVNLHSLLSLIIFILVLIKFENVDWLLASLTGIVGYIAVFFNEITLVYQYIKWFKIPVGQIATNVFLHLKLGLLADMTFVAIIFITLLIRHLTNSRIGVL